MIIIDKGILIEGNNSIRKIAGDAIVSHNRIEEIAEHEQTIKYEAGSEAAVKCLLNSSAASREFEPLIRTDGEINKSLVSTNYIEYCKEKEAIADERLIRLTKSIVNNCVKYSEHSVFIRVTPSDEKPGTIEQIYTDVDLDSFSEKLIEAVTKVESISIEDAIVLTDKLWNTGCIVKHIGVKPLTKTIEIIAIGREYIDSIRMQGIIEDMFGLLRLRIA